MENGKAPSSNWLAGIEIEGAVNIQDYSWAQSKRFVSIYVSYPGINTLDESAIQTRFDVYQFVLLIDGNSSTGINCKDRKILRINNLCKRIEPQQSKVVVKANREMVVIKLRKSETTEWSDLTDVLDKKEAARQQRLQTSLKDASTADLLADMYKHSTDDDRAKLAEAWSKGREKRERKNQV